MYFAYYTTRVNDKVTLRILNRFRDEVLSILNFDDTEEIMFFQSDNGQLDTIEVKGWLTKGKSIGRYVSPYHPNMNGFVERAFGSTNALARSMMAAAGLPDPYWEKASRHAVLLRNIMPNYSADGLTREAYFMWYGLTYDYSRLRTWGSRAYVLNHIRGKDYGPRSVEGIFVGMKPDNPVTRDYEVYLPAKDKFVTSGDVIFCEHVGRREPERLLPPILSLPESLSALDAKDYQDLVDTVHMDNDEGVMYRVLKVYKSRGLVVVDRVLFDQANPSDPGGTIDTVFLRDILEYPIVQGGANPKYSTSVSSEGAVRLATSAAPEGSVNDSRREGFSTTLGSDESLRQKAKRLRTELNAVEEVKNTAAKCATRRQRVRSKLSDTSAVTTDDHDTMIAKVIIDWASDYIPEGLWEPTTEVDSNETLATSSSGNTSISHQYAIEPRHHGEAMARASERDEWIASEKREMDALWELKFAELVPIPPDRILLPSIWVYKYKTDELGNRVLYKSRLVIRGDKAIAGIDYFETYSPVAKIDSMRLVISLIIMHKLIPVQMDIGNAYIQSELLEEVFLKGIPGISIPEGWCYRLLRSLYGLPQAGRNWNNVITKFLTEMGFVQLREDLCVFGYFEDGKLVAVVALWVDDIILGVDSSSRRDWFCNTIGERFKTKVIGLPTNVIGLCIKWEPIDGQLYYKAVHISNPKSVNVLMDKFELKGSRSVQLPYNLSVKLSKGQGPTEQQLLCPEVKQMQNDYRTLVGTFIWLQVTTRVDITQTVLVLSQFVANPAYQHFQAALWLVRYLISTINLGITYSLDGDSTITGYVDADHASHESRRSIYSYIFMFAGGPLFWKNGFETRFSLSTGESEIRAVFALREAIKHILYMKKVFTSLMLKDVSDSATIAMSMLPVSVFEDNLAAIRFSINPSSQSTMKYLEVDILWIHDAIERGDFKLVKIDTKDQLADIGTKFNIAEIFLYLRNLLMK